MKKYEIPQNCPFSLPFLTVIAFHRVKKSPLIIGIVDRIKINSHFHSANQSCRSVRAHFGQSIFSFFQQRRKKDILLILIIFPYFKVQKKREKKKMVSKIDHFFIFLIWKLNLKIQKYC